MPSPAALESACVHIVDEHALVQKAVGNIDLVGVFVKVKGGDARRKNRRLLVILFHLRGGHFGPAMAKVREKFSVLREFDNAVTGHGSGEIDVQLPIHADGLQPARPARSVSLAAPGPENVPVSVELDYFRTQDAAFGTRRRGHGAQFIGPGVVGPIDRPDVIVLIYINVDDLLHAPFVRQSLGPKGVHAVNRSLLRMCPGRGCGKRAEHKQAKRNLSQSIPHEHRWLLLLLVSRLLASRSWFSGTFSNLTALFVMGVKEAPRFTVISSGTRSGRGFWHRRVEGVNVRDADTAEFNSDFR